MWLPSDLNGSPLLVQMLLHKAFAQGMTEDALCQRLGISPTRFNRWKSGVRTCPDPRLPMNRKFYLKAAEFLGVSLGRVLAEVLFQDPSEEKEITRWVHTSLEERKLGIPIPSMSHQAVRKIRTLLLNLPGREEYLDVLLLSLKIYIQDIRKEGWHEDVGSAINFFEKLRTREKDSAETYWGPESKI